MAGTTQNTDITETVRVNNEYDMRYDNDSIMGSDQLNDITIEDKDKLRNDREIDDKINKWNVNIVRERNSMMDLGNSLSRYFKNVKQFNFNVDLIKLKFKNNLSDKDKGILTINIKDYRDKRDLQQQVTKTKFNQINRAIDLKIDKIRKYMFPSKDEKTFLFKRGHGYMGTEKNFDKHVEEIVRKRILDMTVNAEENFKRAKNALEEQDEYDKSLLDADGMEKDVHTTEDRDTDNEKDTDNESNSNGAKDGLSSLGSECNELTTLSLENHARQAEMHDKYYKNPMDEDDDDEEIDESRVPSIDNATMNIMDKTMHLDVYTEYIDRCMTMRSYNMPLNFSVCSNGGMKKIIEAGGDDPYCIWFQPSSYVRNKNQIKKLIYKRIMIVNKRIVLLVNFPIDRVNTEVSDELIATII